MKLRLRLIRASPNFYIISDNHNVSLGNNNCPLYTRRITLKDDFHKKRMGMVAYVPVEFKNLENSAKIFIVPTRQNQFVQWKTFSTTLQFVGSLLQWLKTLLSLARALKNLSGLNSSILAKLKYSKDVSQPLTLMPLIIVAQMLRQRNQWTFKTIYPQFRLTFSTTTM